MAHTDDFNADRGGRTAGTTRRALVQNEIYEHATRLFAERGFAGTSLQDIADALGVTRPALYYYVKSKDELLAKLVHELTHTPAADLRAIVDQTDLEPTDKLRKLAKATATRIATQAERFRLLVKSEAELPPDIAKIHHDGRRAVLAAFTEAIDDGIRTGVFRPVNARTSALGVIGMCNWIAWWHRPNDNIDELTDTLAEMAVASIRRDNYRQPQHQGPRGALTQLREDLDHLERILTDENPKNGTVGDCP